MHGDGWVDQAAPKGPKPCEDAIFVRASKPGVADDVGYQDRSEFPGVAHGASAEAGRFARSSGLSMAALPRCTLRRTWKQGVQAPRVDRPVYPRRVDHSTLAKGGIANGPRLCTSDPFSDFVSDRRQLDDRSLSLSAV